MSDSTLPSLLQQHLMEYQLQNYSARTIEFKTDVLSRFIAWCDERGVSRAEEIGSEVVHGFRRYLFHYRNPGTGRPLHFSTQGGFLIHLRLFCRWLLKQRLVSYDPSSDLQIPKASRHTLSDVLTNDEINLLLNTPNLERPFGIRDRAILETFYSTAIRASELAALRQSDIDDDLQQVRVLHGKGGKDRLLPIGSEALDWIAKYSNDVRSDLVSSGSENYLFLGKNGQRMDRNALAQVVRRLLRKAGITKRGSCHLLRHTAATLMMENGADIRSLQSYLGHARLDTTQIYTHMTLGRLREVHSKTHPRGDEFLGKQSDSSNQNGSDPEP